MADQKSSAGSLPSGWTMELKVRRDGRKDKFVVEKVVAEELSPGWIKEMRVKSQGHKIRRDLYYTDPVSGYVFRSMKDVVRYLETGELGRLASKPKDKGNSNMELEDNKISSPAVAEGQNFAESGINRQIIENPSLKLVGVVKEEQNLESTCTGDCMPFSEQTSDQCMEGAAGNSFDLPESKDLKQGGGSGDSSISSVSAHVVGALPEKQRLEGGVGRHRNRKIQLGLNKRKEPQLPRRASKRLAGIEVDPPAEIKTKNRARRVAARRSDEAEYSTDENLGKLTAQEEHDEKREADSKADKKQERPLVSPLKNPSIPEEHAGVVETDHKANEKPGSSPPDLYSDPCIDFAIKTLTGAIPIENENKADGGDPHPNPIGDENKADENPGCSVDSWTDPCIEFAIKTLTGAIPIGDENKAEDNIDWTYGDLWTDPCIEFAVKTLTGAIPLGDDLSVPNYFLRQPNSSESQGTNGLNLENAGLDFCHADILCQQLHTAEKPLLKQQESVTSNLPNTGNVSLQNSGGGLHQHIEGRSEQCSRQTML